MAVLDEDASFPAKKHAKKQPLPEPSRCDGWARAQENEFAILQCLPDDGMRTPVKSAFDR